MPVYAPGLDSQGRKTERVGQAIRPAKSLEVQYRTELLRVKRTLQDEYLRLYQQIRDGLINQADALRRIEQVEQALDRRLSVRGRELATKIVHQASATNKDRLEGLFKRMYGIDVFAIIDEQGLQDVLGGMIEENVNLIVSLPHDSLQAVRRAVIDNFSGTGPPLIDRINEIGARTTASARLIARDQTSKLNAAINQARQQSIGIEEYIWRTSKDERVVGRPGGMYPKGNDKHGNHWEREGKKFRWDSPPHDGHPGTPINDRCRAEPVIDLDKIRKI